ncbi:MAG: SURF1 family protein [Albidovulum sp.]|nr:SURF1 family protein [Albidovulum sp.]
MTRAAIGPAIFGIVGIAVLLSLGIWQLQRLQWKEGLLAEIDARIGADPGMLPEFPDQSTDNFRAVSLSGRIVGSPLRVLTSRRGLGPGFRVVSAFETDGRRVLLDRGFIAESRMALASDDATLDVVGNLHWPDEWDRFFTPKPEADLWFARDVEMMAAALGTEAVMVVSRDSDGDASFVVPWPVDSHGIPNNHLQYAATWFSLAAAWLAMTTYWVWRIGRRSA